ncbi:hypothetical protein [Proteocatella sphenisci]|uniref:hypothetical protein n=1 Tax=Proteocatella sphenisci TaxID=181070 RepID=UPI00048E10A0|nr:hypothetical protein [Proteocatella sphenisci]
MNQALFAFNCNYKVNMFSGGELKRLEIASVLARKLKVVLFEEPKAGIDVLIVAGCGIHNSGCNTAQNDDFWRIVKWMEQRE